MIENLKNVFGSRLRALDMLYFLEGEKEVVRQLVSDEKLSSIEDFCKKNNLFIESPPHKVVFEDDEVFSDEGKIVNQDNNEGFNPIYISEGEFKAAKTCLFETEQKHEETGLLLGYPICCSEFFSDKIKSKDISPVQEPSNPWTNITKRDEDICFISHIPCSPNCGESIRLGKKHFRIIEKYDEELANEMKVRLTP